MERILEKIYLGIIGIVFVVALSSPYIINSSFSFVEEEFLEGILIFVSFVVGIFVFNLYKKEIKKGQDKLNDSFLYIGEINVQLQEMSEAFLKLDDYPVSKKKFKEIKVFLLEKILGIVNVDWAIFRIIEIDTHKTLQEGIENRSATVLLKYDIANKDLVEGKKFKDYKIIRSANSNLFIDTFCIIPNVSLNNNQLFMIKFIVKQLEQTFLLFSFMNKNKDIDKIYFKKT